MIIYIIILILILLIVLIIVNYNYSETFVDLIETTELDNFNNLFNTNIKSDEIIFAVGYKNNEHLFYKNNETITNSYIDNNRLYSKLNNKLDYVTLPTNENEIIYLNNTDGLFTSSKIYIPKNIYQTHKSMEYIKTKPEILNAVNSWKKYEDEFNYYFYDDNQIEQFIKDNFNEDTYKAYVKLPMAVMKADLWRYCIIYINGGIYADTDTVCKSNPNIFLKNDCLLAFVAENKVHLCQWIFAAPKKSPILKIIIDLSVKRILEMDEIKGEHIIHHLTGPAVFTDGIELYLKNNNLPLFNNKIDYYNYIDKCIYVFNNTYFHNNIVVHLFSGMHEDGWTKERDIKLM
jgi:mannosyltransferase OCH1-like enzyme